MLKYILRTIHSDINFEVINCGVTAITSHSVLDMSREILDKYKPDLLVIYTGHNEFYGVFGQASHLALFHSQLLTQTFLKLQKLRIFRLVRDFYFRLFGNSMSTGTVADPATLMGSIAKQAGIVYGSEVFQQTAETFRKNLESVVRKANSRDTDVILCTLVDNLKDLEPFESRHGEAIDLKSAEKAEQLNEDAKKFMANNQFDLAIKKLTESLEYDSDYADTYYLLGECYFATQNYPMAQEQYKLARDLDVIRFRAASDFNSIIKEIAVKFNVPLVDMERSFELSSPGGIVGHNLILEHIHPNHKGYLLMGKAIARTMSDYGMVRPEWKWNRNKPDSVYLAMSRLTPLSREVVNAAVFRLTSHWPFRTANQDREYQRVGTERTEKLARRFVANQDVDLIQLHLNLGYKYFTENQTDKALAEYRAALAIEPTCETYNRIGLVYLRQTREATRAKNKIGLALRYFRKALNNFNNGLAGCPDNVKLNLNRGRLLALLKNRKDEAINSFQKALSVEPTNKVVLKHLIRIYLKEKEYDKAKTYLLRAVRAHPEESEFYYDLGIIYFMEKKYSEAEQSLQEALKLNPNDENVNTLLKKLQNIIKS